MSKIEDFRVLDEIEYPTLFPIDQKSERELLKEFNESYLSFMRQDKISRPYVDFDKIRRDLIREYMIELMKKVENGQTLSLEEIQKIKEMLKIQEDRSILNNLLILLNKDIELRKKIYGVECISELYRGENLLPENLRIPKPRPNDIEDLIKERWRAIVLHEYRRLHRLTGLEFIKGKLTYDEYIRKTKEYALIASGLYPR